MGWKSQQKDPCILYVSQFNPICSFPEIWAFGNSRRFKVCLNHLNVRSTRRAKLLNRSKKLKIEYANCKNHLGVMEIQSCEMSIFLHRADLSIQILPQENSRNKFCLAYKLNKTDLKGYFWTTYVENSSKLCLFYKEFHIFTNISWSDKTLCSPKLFVNPDL